jgi:L-alanine-DL-glutamate epimerase-like enolase superfamily enzyme
MPHFSYEKLTLNLRNPFHLSYGTSDTRDAFILRLEGNAGLGEGTIPPYYRVDPVAMTALWDHLAKQPARLPDDHAEIAAWVGTDGPPAARCAVELALLDRIGRLRGLPLHALLGLPAPRPLATSFTISGEAETMAQQARQARHFSIIKLKLGSGDDVARVAAVRAALPDARLFVDANAGWSRAEALRLVNELNPFNLELIEQPVEKDDIEGMGLVQAATRIPVVADEAAQSLEQVERLAAAGVQGVNLKLMKLGGLLPAVAIANRARELGMRIMLGSMIETSIGATAMAHLIGLAEWLDLDSPLLIGNDPFDGLRYDAAGQVSLPDRPGIGAIARAHASL